MKKLSSFVCVLLIASLFFLESCGPVVFAVRSSNPPPPWFYPNRIETVRYVYFPEHYIYYDLSLSTYLFLDNGIWISATVLPSRYNNINFRRSRYSRINNYFGDNIGRYHNDSRNTSRSRRTTTPRRRNK